MTDRYEKIRKALAMGPTPGPWELRDGRTDTVENAQGYPVCTVHYHPDERYSHGTRAAYIAACDPDTIAALLEERDALREALKMLVNWTPSADTYRRLGFNPEVPMRAHETAKAALANGEQMKVVLSGPIKGR